jgi:hypothetical protein
MSILVLSTNRGWNFTYKINQYFISPKSILIFSTKAADVNDINYFCHVIRFPQNEI